MKVWNVPESECLMTFRGIILYFDVGHRDRVSAVDFHPQSTISQSLDSVNMVSGSVDGTVHLWSLTQYFLLRI